MPAGIESVMLSKELIESTKRHEGYRQQAYQDSVGVWTIGYGTNLQVLKISEELAEAWLISELEACAKALSHHPVYERMNQARKDVLTEMAYNLGLKGLYGFKRMWVALGREDWEQAKLEGLDSKWAEQVGARARRLMDKLERGE